MDAMEAVTGPVRRLVRTVDFITKSFQAKLVALVLLSVVVTSTVIGVTTMGRTKSFLTSKVQEEFRATLESARAEIDAWYQSRMFDLKVVFHARGFVSSLEGYFNAVDQQERALQRNQITKYFSYVKEKLPVYESFVVMDSHGRNMVASVHENELDTDLLETLRREVRDEPYLSQAFHADDNTRVMQWVLVPVQLGNNVRATVFARMDLRALTEMLAGVSLSPAGDLYILDEEGSFLTQPRKAPLGEDGGPVVMLGQRAMKVPAIAAERDFPSVEKYAKKRWRADGVAGAEDTFLASKVFMSQQRWWLVCEDLERQVIAPVLDVKNQIVVADLLICLLFLLLSWKMSRYLLRPIAALSLGARRINQGMVAVEIPDAGPDEIGQMISAFNDMAKRISLTEAELNATNKKLQRQNEQLEEANNRLEELSVTDGLTGLYNHRHFWNLMNSELTRANLYQGELGLILLDVDNFKQVNDEFGHTSGDLVIQRVAKIILGSVRETDLVARYGGEEFAVLLPDTSRKGVLAVSEKVRSAVEQMYFKVPDADITISITVSVGVSVFRGSRREFFNAADRALYMSKSRGKNQVSFAMAGA